MAQRRFETSLREGSNFGMTIYEFTGTTIIERVCPLTGTSRWFREPEDGTARRVFRSCLPLTIQIFRWENETQTGKKRLAQGQSDLMAKPSISCKFQISGLFLSHGHHELTKFLFSSSTWENFQPNLVKLCTYAILAYILSLIPF